MKRSAWRGKPGCLIVFFACSLQVFAATKQEPFRAGVHFSSDHPFRSKQLKTILSGLQFWTGLSEITVNSNGDLVLGNRSCITGGSTTARELMIAAVDSNDSFAIESRDNSPTIAFAQIASTFTYIDANGGRHSEWQLRLDFSDFTELTGTRDTLVAFDPAINVLHELTHAVRRYFDPTDESDELGECETYINKMRSELELPQRIHYYPRHKLREKNDGSSFMQGEIRFADSDQTELSMTFNLDKVFDRSNAKSKATAQATLLAQKHRQVR